MDMQKTKKAWYKRVWLWVGLVILLFIIVGAAGSGSRGTVNTTPASNSTSSSSAAAKTQRPTAKVGDTVTIGGDQGLAVKLMQVIDPAESSNQVVSSDAGKRFVGLKVQITNNGSSSYKDDANNNLTLIGSDNQSYTATFADISGCTNFSSGQYTLAKGSSATGCVVYQVPNGVKPSKVQFTTNSGFSGDTREWSIQ